MNCGVCGGRELVKFLSLGNQPLANSFIRHADAQEGEPFYPLDLVFCKDCTLVQLSEESMVPREILFKEYIYASSTSATFRKHFEQLASKLAADIRLDKRSLVIDIGSNDGVLVKPLKELGLQSVGVEPAANLAKIAQQAGLETINAFFHRETVRQIVAKCGNADVIAACNVFAHVGDLHAFVENVHVLLKDSGVFVIEVQYLFDMIKKLTFDNIYHEHVFYFTLRPLLNLFGRHGMRVFRVERIPTHGGSLRVYATKSDTPVENSVFEVLAAEEECGLGRADTFGAFASGVQEFRAEIVLLIRKIKSEGKHIAGYGAPAKASTLLNFAEIGRDYVSYIVDESPLKQGLLTPGTHIPVVSPRALDYERPDYVLILAWNFAEDILKKCEKYRQDGVRFITPLPPPITIA